MVEVSIEGNKAIFAVQGSHKLWALRRYVSILTALARTDWRAVRLRPLIGSV
jgi:hypothetical protein